MLVATCQGFTCASPNSFPVRRHGRGATLIETVVALVLLGGCLLLVSAIMQKTAQYQRRSESLLEASGYADEVLDDIREWAKTPANYDGNWAAWDGRVLTSGTFPGLSARVDVQTTGLADLYSPDTQAEALYPSDRRALDRAYVQVLVQAGRDLSSPIGRVDVIAQLAPPAPAPAPAAASDFSIVISGSTSVAVGGTGTFSAQAFAGGRLLPPVTFEWHLHNDDGEAEAETPSRDGRSFRIVHNQTRWDDVLGEIPASGNVEVEAVARIMGRIVRGYHGVSLAAP